MRKSELRNKILEIILNDVSEEDYEEVCLVIDEIENEAQSARDILDDIDGIGDLHKVEDARGAINDLAEALY